MDHWGLIVYFISTSTAECMFVSSSVSGLECSRVSRPEKGPWLAFSCFFIPFVYFPFLLFSRWFVFSPPWTNLTPLFSNLTCVVVKPIQLHTSVWRIWGVVALCLEGLKRVGNNSIALFDTDPISSKGYYQHTVMSDITNGGGAPN